MVDFQIAGDDYRTLRMAPKVQMRLLRRLARIAPALKRASGIANLMKTGGQPTDDQIADVLVPIVTAFGDMSDDDVEYIIDTSLDHAEHRPNSGPSASERRYFKVRLNGMVSNHVNEELNRSLVITYHVLSDNFSTVFNSMGPAIEPAGV